MCRSFVPKCLLSTKQKFHSKSQSTSGKLRFSVDKILLKLLYYPTFQLHVINDLFLKSFWHDSFDVLVHLYYIHTHKHTHTHTHIYIYIYIYKYIYAPMNRIIDAYLFGMSVVVCILHLQSPFSCKWVSFNNQPAAKGFINNFCAASY